jgi:hypothetical protein
MAKTKKKEADFERKMRGCFCFGSLGNSKGNVRVIGFHFLAFHVNFKI